MQRIYAEQAQPGPEHEMLARMAGSWDQELKMWPERGAEPMVMRGVGESRLILGGRFLVGETSFEGIEEPVGFSLLGFDRRSGEYMAMGVDMSGTYWVTARGKPTPGSADVVLSGEDYNPALDHLQIYDFVLTWVDDDTYTWSVIFKDDIHTGGGPPFKMAETTVRRRP